jgi:hypothetical protein
MDFIYEIVPVFLCGFAAGIVLTALVGWVIKGDLGGAEVNGAQEPNGEDKPKKQPHSKFPLPIEAIKKNDSKKNKAGEYAII